MSTHNQDKHLRMILSLLKMIVVQMRKILDNSGLTIKLFSKKLVLLLIFDKSLRRISKTVHFSKVLGRHILQKINSGNPDGFCYSHIERELFVWYSKRVCMKNFKISTVCENLLYPILKKCSKVNNKVRVHNVILVSLLSAWNTFFTLFCC